MLRNRHSDVASKTFKNKLKYTMHTILFDNDESFTDHMEVVYTSNIKLTLHYLMPVRIKEHFIIESDS